MISWSLFSIHFCTPYILVYISSSSRERDEGGWTFEMMKVSFIIIVLLMVGIVSGKISTKKVSPSPSPSPYSYAPQSETRMSPSSSPSDSPTTMPPGYIHQPPSLSPEESDLKYKDGSGTERECSSGGGKKAGIAVGVIAAAGMVGLGGYVLKKRRENIRRSRYEYAATEIFWRDRNLVMDVVCRFLCFELMYNLISFCPNNGG